MHEIYIRTKDKDVMNVEDYPTIVVKRYATFMSDILKEGRRGKVMLTKKIILKGTVLRTYDAKQGRFYKGRMDDDMPIVALSEDGGVWMSDTPQAQESLEPVIKRARGDVLVAGLGIGYVPTLLSRKPNVNRIDIVEKNRDVINLVYPQVWTSKHRIIKGDVFRILANTSYRYDFIHIDVWMGILQPLKEIQRVTTLARRCLKPHGEVHCWTQELYNRVKDAIPKHPIMATNRAGFHAPCLICSKTLRFDYAGLCMDCADILEVSEMFITRTV